MSLIEIIEHLNIAPRHQEEEYEYTSDFLEWFYYNVYRQQGFTVYPILSKIVNDPEYKCIEELCRDLINWRYGTSLDNETLTKKYELMKQWTIDTINKFNQNQ